MKNETEINELLNKFVDLRDKCSKSKNKKYHLEYHKYKTLCLNELDYLVESKTKKYRSFANYEDLKQEGRTALMLALNSYNPSKGNFYWWANQYIKTKVCREANRHSVMKIPLKHTKEMPPYKVSQFPIMVDHEPNGYDVCSVRELKTVIKDAINKLPDNQKRVINLYYELGDANACTVNQICKKLNVSRMNFLKLLDEAKLNLKNSLKTEFC